MTSELPRRGRLRLERDPSLNGWRIATPTHRFSVKPTDHRTVRELLTQHGADFLEVGALRYATDDEIMLRHVIEGAARGLPPVGATRPQPEPLAPPDAAAPLSPGDGGALHGGLGGPEQAVRAAVDLFNADVRVARAAGFTVEAGIDTIGPRMLNVTITKPEPPPPAVDPDLIAARDVAADTATFYGSLNGSAYEERHAVRQGKRDDCAVVKVALAAIKRGRELAAPKNVAGHPVEFEPGKWAIWTISAYAPHSQTTPHTSCEVCVKWTGPANMLPEAAVFWDAEREAFNGAGLGVLMPGWKWRRESGEGLAVVWVP